MKNQYHLAVGGLTILFTALSLRAPAEPLATALDTSGDLVAWTTTGKTSVAPQGGRTGGCLEVPPGATARWTVRDADGSGRVSLWVYDDGTAPADPSVRRGGPHWGVETRGGRILAAGIIYAPYLSGASTYAAPEYAPDEGEVPWQMVRYLGLSRDARWHNWTFDFNPDRGLTILYDGINVNAERLRFDWTKSKVEGFAGVVIIGDLGPAPGQTIRIDDVTVELGGPMRVKPTTLPPPVEAGP